MRNPFGTRLSFSHRGQDYIVLLSAQPADHWIWRCELNGEAIGDGTPIKGHLQALSEAIHAATKAIDWLLEMQSDSQK